MNETQEEIELQRSELSIGDIAIVSYSHSIEELLQFVELALKNKTIRSYLEILKQRKLMTSSYAG